MNVVALATTFIQDCGMLAFVSGPIGGLLTLIALITPWAFYGDIDISVTRFNSWPVYAVSAIVLQIVVVWAHFLPGRWPRARLWVGLACAVVAAASAIVLGSRYDNGPDFFDDVMPLVMVMPAPGPGSLAAVLAVVANTISLVLNRNRSTSVNMARTLPASTVQK